MWKSSSARSTNGSEIPSRSDRRKEDDEPPPHRPRTRSDSATTSSARRKASRRDDHDRIGDFHPTSTAFSSSARSLYADVAAPSVASSYATAYTDARAGSSMRPPNLVRNDSMAETVAKEATREKRRESKRSNRPGDVRDRDGGEDNTRNVGREDRERSGKRHDSRKSSGIEKEKNSSSSAAFHNAALPQNQFPGEPLGDYAQPYRPPGLAAEYYGDQGQSVDLQPGVRPNMPSIITSADQAHLQEPYIEPRPPAEPSSIGQAGAASAFYTIGGESSTSSQGTPSKPGQHSSMRPSKYSEPASGSTSSPRPNGRTSRPQSAFYSHTNNTLGAVAMTAGAGLAADHYAIHNGSNNAQNYRVDSSYQASIDQNAYHRPGHGLAGQAFGPGIPPNHPSNMPSHNTTASGLAGAIEGSFGASQPYPRLQQRHRQKRAGPLRKVVDWFRDPQGVAEFEQYTEAIGVCRYCFDPHSSAAEAPRRHHYHSHGPQRRSSGSKYGSSTRVDKTYRHSSDEDRRKRSTSKRIVAGGITGYGAAKLGEAIYKQKNDFNDTYSVKSGRPINRSRVSFKDDEDRRSNRSQNRYSSAEDLRHDHQDALREGRKDEGRLTKRPSRRRSSSSSSGGISRGAALSIGAGATGLAMAGAASDRRRRSRSRSRSPAKKKYYSKRVSPQHSYVDLRTSDTGSFGLKTFFNSPSANQRKGKKPKGLFNFANISSSSSDADLAFGEGTVKRKSSYKGHRSESKRKESGFGDNAAILGLVATGAALASESDRRHNKNKVRHDAEPPIGLDSKRTTSPRISRQTHGSRFDADNDDAWEDASDDDKSSSSIDTALAYGGRVSARQSRESLLSNQGTSRWAWRWNKGKGKEKERERQHRPATAEPQPAPYDAIIASAIGAGVGAAAASVFHTESPAVPGYKNMPPMQYVDPVPAPEPQYDDAQRTLPPYEPMSWADVQHPSLYASTSSVPLQQPQPIAPVSSSVYDIQPLPAPLKRSASGPAGMPELTRQDRARVTESPQQIDVDERPHYRTAEPVREPKFRRRRDSSPRILPSQASRNSVAFELTDEQAEAEQKSKDKEERRRRRWEEKERRQSTGTSIIEHTTPTTAGTGVSTTNVSKEKPSDAITEREAEIERELRRLYDEERRQEEQRKRDEDERKRMVEYAGTAAGAVAVGAGVASVAAIGKDKRSDGTDEERMPKRKSSLKKNKDRNSPPIADTQQERIARMAAQRVRSTPSPIHEDYSTFFVPTELAEHLKEHNEAADRRDDIAAHVLEIVPGGAKRKDKFDPFTYHLFGVAPEDDPALHPWPVPMLDLVEPTPPSSRIHSVKGDASPAIRPEKDDLANEQIGDEFERHNSKVTWGDPDTYVYEVQTPEYERQDHAAEELSRVLTVEDDMNTSGREQQAVPPVEAMTKEQLEHVSLGKGFEDLPPSSRERTLSEPDEGSEGVYVLDEPSPTIEVDLEDRLGGKSFYQSPFAETAETASDLGTVVVASDVPKTGHGFVEDQELPPTPGDGFDANEREPNFSNTEELDVPVVRAESRLSKSERRRMERAALANETSRSVGPFGENASEEEELGDLPKVPGDISVFDYLVGENGETLPSVSVLGAATSTIGQGVSALRAAASDVLQGHSNIQGDGAAAGEDSHDDRHDQRTVALDEVTRPQRASTSEDLQLQPSRAKTNPDFASDPEEWEKLSSVKKAKDKKKRSSKSDIGVGSKSALVGSVAAAASVATAALNEDDFYAREKSQKRKSKREAEIMDDADNKSVASDPVTYRNEEKKSKRRSRREGEIIDDDDTRSVTSSPATFKGEDRKAKSRSKRGSEVLEDDDTKSAVSSPAAFNDNEQKPRRWSKRDSEILDDDDVRSVASTPVDTKNKSKEKKSSGGLFGLFSSNKSDVGTSSKQSSKSTKSEGRAERDRAEDMEKRRKKRSSKDTDHFDDTRSAASEPVHRTRRESLPLSEGKKTVHDSRHQSIDDGYVPIDEARQSARDALNDPDSSFLAEGLEMPQPMAIHMPMDTDGASGLTTETEASREPDTVVLECEVLPSDENITPLQDLHESLDTHTQATVPDPDMASMADILDELQEQNQTGQAPGSASIGDVLIEDEPLPSVGAKTPLQTRQRRLSAIRTTDIGSSPASINSPTAVPLHFRRLPVSPATARASLSSPVLAPDSPSATTRTRQNRPKSTEFRSSKEFRPLYLVERSNYAKVVTPEAEGQYPSLPSSRTSSAHPSMENLRAEAETPSHQDYFSSEGISPVMFKDPSRRHSYSFWNDDNQPVEAPDFLDSRSATPVPSEVQKAREVDGHKGKPKYEFHSPSELLQDPTMHEDLIDEDYEPRSGSPLPSVVSTDQDQEYVSARSQSQSPSRSREGVRRRPSKSRSRSRSKIRSDTVAATGLGFLSGTVLGLAANHVMNRPEEQISADVLAAHEEGEVEDMYNAGDVPTCASTPPPAQTDHAISMSLPSEELVIPPTEVQPMADTLRDTANEPIFPEAASEGDFDHTHRNLEKSKKDKKKKRKTVALPDAVEVVDQGTGREEAPVPAQPQIQETAQASSSPISEAAPQIAAIRAEPGVISRSAYTVAETQDLDVALVSDVELANPSEADISKGEVDGWAAPASKPKKDKKKKRKTMDLEATVQISATETPNEAELPPVPLEVAAQSHFAAEPEIPSILPVEQSRSTTEQQESESMAVHGSVPRAIDGDAKSASYLEVETPVVEEDEWALPTKKSKKNGKKKSKTLVLSEPSIRVAGVAEDIGSNEDIRTEEIQPDASSLEERALDAVEVPTAHEEELDIGTTPTPGVTQEPGVPATLETQSEAAAEEDDWAMPAKKSKKDKKKKRTILLTSVSGGTEPEATNADEHTQANRNTTVKEIEPIDLDAIKEAAQIMGVSSIPAEQDITGSVLPLTEDNTLEDGPDALSHVADNRAPDILPETDEWALPAKKVKKDKKKKGKVLNAPDVEVVEKGTVEDDRRFEPAQAAESSALDSLARDAEVTKTPGVLTDQVVDEGITPQMDDTGIESAREVIPKTVTALTVPAEEDEWALPVKKSRKDKKKKTKVDETPSTPTTGIEQGQAIFAVPLANPQLDVPVTAKTPGTSANASDGLEEALESAVCPQRIDDDMRLEEPSELPSPRRGNALLEAIDDFSPSGTSDVIAMDDVALPEETQPQDEDDWALPARKPRKDKRKDEKSGKRRDEGVSTGKAEDLAPNDTMTQANIRSEDVDLSRPEIAEDGLQRDANESGPHDHETVIPVAVQPEESSHTESGHAEVKPVPAQKGWFASALSFVPGFSNKQTEKSTEPLEKVDRPLEDPPLTLPSARDLHAEPVHQQWLADTHSNVSQFPLKPVAEVPTNRTISEEGYLLDINAADVADKPTGDEQVEEDDFASVPAKKSKKEKKSKRKSRTTADAEDGIPEDPLAMEPQPQKQQDSKDEAIPDSSAHEDLQSEHNPEAVAEEEFGFLSGKKKKDKKSKRKPTALMESDTALPEDTGDRAMFGSTLEEGKDRATTDNGFAPAEDDIEAALPDLAKDEAEELLGSEPQQHGQEASLEEPENPEVIPLPETPLASTPAQEGDDVSWNNGRKNKKDKKSKKRSTFTAEPASSDFPSEFEIQQTGPSDHIADSAAGLTTVALAGAVMPVADLETPEATPQKEVEDNFSWVPSTKKSKKDKKKRKSVAWTAVEGSVSGKEDFPDDTVANQSRNDTGADEPSIHLGRDIAHVDQPVDELVPGTSLSGSDSGQAQSTGIEIQTMGIDLTPLDKDQVSEPNPDAAQERTEKLVVDLAPVSVDADQAPHISHEMPQQDTSSTPIKLELPADEAPEDYAWAPTPGKKKSKKDKKKKSGDFLPGNLEETPPLEDAAPVTAQMGMPAENDDWAMPTKRSKKKGKRASALEVETLVEGETAVSKADPTTTTPTLNESLVIGHDQAFEEPEQIRERARGVGDEFSESSGLGKAEEPATSVAEEDEWAAPEKKTKKGKKKRQSTIKFDDVINGSEASTAAVAEEVPRDLQETSMVEEPTGVAEEPKDVDRSESAVLQQAAEKTPLPETPMVEEDEWAVPTKKSKKGKKQRASTTDSDEPVIAETGAGHAVAESASSALAEPKSMLSNEPPSLEPNIVAEELQAAEETPLPATPLADNDEWALPTKKGKKDKKKKRSLNVTFDEASIADKESELALENSVDEPQDIHLAMPAEGPLDVEQIPVVEELSMAEETPLPPTPADEKQDEWATPAKKGKKDKKKKRSSTVTFDEPDAAEGAELAIREATPAELQPFEQIEAIEMVHIAEETPLPATPGTEDNDEWAVPTKKSKKDKKKQGSNVVTFDEPVEVKKAEAALQEATPFNLQSFDQIEAAEELQVAEETPLPATPAMEDDESAVPVKKSKKDRKKRASNVTFDELNNPTEVDTTLQEVIPPSLQPFERAEAAEELQVAEETPLPATPATEGDEWAVPVKKIKKDKKKRASNVAFEDPTMDIQAEPLVTEPTPGDAKGVEPEEAGEAFSTAPATPVAEGDANLSGLIASKDTEHEDVLPNGSRDLSDVEAAQETPSFVTEEDDWAAQPAKKGKKDKKKHRLAGFDEPTEAAVEVEEPQNAHNASASLIDDESLLTDMTDSFATPMDEQAEWAPVTKASKKDKKKKRSSVMFEEPVEPAEVQQVPENVPEGTEQPTTIPGEAPNMTSSTTPTGIPVEEDEWAVPTKKAKKDKRKRSSANILDEPTEQIEAAEAILDDAAPVNAGVEAGFATAQANEPNNPTKVDAAVQEAIPLSLQPFEQAEAAEELQVAEETPLPVTPAVEEDDWAVTSSKKGKKDKKKKRTPTVSFDDPAAEDGESTTAAQLAFDHIEEPTTIVQETPLPATPAVEEDQWGLPTKKNKKDKKKRASAMTDDAPVIQGDAALMGLEEQTTLVDQIPRTVIEPETGDQPAAEQDEWAIPSETGRKEKGKQGSRVTLDEAAATVEVEQILASHPEEPLKVDEASATVVEIEPTITAMVEDDEWAVPKKANKDKKKKLASAPDLKTPAEPSFTAQQPSASIIEETSNTFQNMPVPSADIQEPANLVTNESAVALRDELQPIVGEGHDQELDNQSDVVQAATTPLVEETEWDVSSKKGKKDKKKKRAVAVDLDVSPDRDIPLQDDQEAATTEAQLPATPAAEQDEWATSTRKGKKDKKKKRPSAMAASLEELAENEHAKSAPIVESEFEPEAQRDEVADAPPVEQDEWAVPSKKGKKKRKPDTVVEDPYNAGEPADRERAAPPIDKDAQEARQPTIEQEPETLLSVSGDIELEHEQQEQVKHVLETDLAQEREAIFATVLSPSSQQLATDEEPKGFAHALQASAEREEDLHSAAPEVHPQPSEMKEVSPVLNQVQSMIAHDNLIPESPISEPTFDQDKDDTPKVVEQVIAEGTPLPVTPAAEADEWAVPARKSKKDKKKKRESVKEFEDPSAGRPLEVVEAPLQEENSHIPEKTDPEVARTTYEESQSIESAPAMQEADPVEDEWAMPVKKGKKDKKKKRQSLFDIEPHSAETSTPAEFGIPEPKSVAFEEVPLPTLSQEEPRALEFVESVKDCEPIQDDSAVSSKQSRTDKKKWQSLYDMEPTSAVDPAFDDDKFDDNQVISPAVPDERELKSPRQEGTQTLGATEAGNGAEFNQSDWATSSRKPKKDSKGKKQSTLTDFDAAQDISSSVPADMTAALSLIPAAAIVIDDLIGPSRFEQTLPPSEEEGTTIQDEKDEELPNLDEVRKEMVNTGWSVEERLPPVGHEPVRVDTVIDADAPSQEQEGSDRNVVEAAASQPEAPEPLSAEEVLEFSTKTSKRDKKKKRATMADVPTTWDSITDPVIEPEAKSLPVVVDLDWTTPAPTPGNEVRDAMDEALVTAIPETPAEEDAWAFSTKKSKKDKKKRQSANKAELIESVADDNAKSATDPTTEQALSVEELAIAEEIPLPATPVVEEDDWALSKTLKKDMKEKKRQPALGKLTMASEPGQIAVSDAATVETEILPTAKAIESLSTAVDTPLPATPTADEDDPWSSTAKKFKKDKKKKKQTAFEEEPIPVVAAVEPAFEVDIAHGDMDTAPTAEEDLWASTSQKSKKDKKKNKRQPAMQEEDESTAAEVAEDAALEPETRAAIHDRSLEPTVEATGVEEVLWEVPTKKSKKDKKIKRQSTFDDTAEHLEQPPLVEEPRSTETNPMEDVGRSDQDKPSVMTEIGAGGLAGVVAGAILSSSQPAQEAEDEWAGSTKKSKKDRKKKRQSIFEDSATISEILTPIEEPQRSTSLEIFPDNEARGTVQTIPDSDTPAGAGILSVSEVQDKEDTSLKTSKRSKKDKKKKKSSAPWEEDESFAVQENDEMLVSEVEPNRAQTSEEVEHQESPRHLDAAESARDVVSMPSPSRDMEQLSPQHRGVSMDEHPTFADEYGAEHVAETSNQITLDQEPTPQQQEHRDVFQERLPADMPTDDNWGVSTKKSKKDKKGKNKKTSTPQEIVPDDYSATIPGVVESEPVAVSFLPYTSDKTDRELSEDHPAQVEDGSDTGSNISASTRERRKRRKSPPTWTGEEPADLPRSQALTPPPEHNDIMDTALGVAAGLGFGHSERPSKQGRPREMEQRPTAAEPPSWSFANLGHNYSPAVAAATRDSAVQFEDSPSLGQVPFEQTRDSGFISNPRMSQALGEDVHDDRRLPVSPRPLRPQSPTSSTEDIRSTRRYSRHTHPEDAPSGSASMQPSALHETPGRRQPSPVDPMSKDRSSTLFQSSPAVLTPHAVQQLATGMHHTPSVHGHRHSREELRAIAQSPHRQQGPDALASSLIDRAAASKIDRSTFSPSPRQSVDRQFSSPRASLNTIHENGQVVLSPTPQPADNVSDTSSRQRQRGVQQERPASDLGKAAAVVGAATAAGRAAASLTGDPRDLPSTSQAKSLGRSKSRTSSLRNLRANTTSPLDLSNVASSSSHSVADDRASDKAVARDADMADVYVSSMLFPFSLLLSHIALMHVTNSGFRRMAMAPSHQVQGLQLDHQA